MEVLQARSPSPTQASLPTSAASYGHRSLHPTPSPARTSLLDRRAHRSSDLLDSLLHLSSSAPSTPARRSSQALSLLYASPHSPGQTECYPNTGTGTHASPSVMMSPATATGTLRAPRKASAASLTFVPLTPIMASPRLTPEISTDASSLESASARFSQEIILRDAAHAGPVPERADDYLTGGPRRSASLRHSSSTNTISASSTAYSMMLHHPTPRWQSTPPTPPPRHAGPALYASGASPGASVHRKPSRTGRRPESVSVFPDRTRPNSSSPHRARPYPARLSSEDLPTSRRRHSLPPNLSKPLPPVPPADGPPAAAHLHARNGSPLRVSMIARVDSASSGASGSGRSYMSALESPTRTELQVEEGRSTLMKKLFHIDDGEGGDGDGDGDGSDREEEPPGGSAEGTSRGHSGENVLVADQVQEPETLGEEPAQAHAPAPETERERETERLRAGRRRYHALMELLATEVGYLMDLRALVSVYLEQLHTLSTTAPHSSSALSLPGLSRSIPASRSAFLHPSSPLPSPSISASSHLGSDPGHGPPDDRDREAEKEKARARSSWAGPTKLDAEAQDAHRRSATDERPASPAQPAKGKHARRALFADKDVRTVCRNAGALLRFHERFVEELRAAVGPAGFGAAFVLGRRDADAEAAEQMATARIDEAVGAVAEKFVAQAPAFGLYETFCPGHSEAADLVRSVQENYPVEWDAYEQRCSLLIAHTFDLVAPPAAAAPSAYRGPVAEDEELPRTPASASFAVPPPFHARKTRRHSTSSLSIPEVISPMPVTTSHMSVVATTQTEPSPRKRKGSGAAASAAHKGQPQATRLKFLDYLIKPVQRICKYPLLLDQLKRSRDSEPSGTSPGATETEDAMDAVESAGEAMRVVVGLVDRASEAQAHIVKSLLVASRMACVPSPPASMGHGSGTEKPPRPISPHAGMQGLTPEFVVSLGPCHLVGALDVVHHPSALHAPSGGTLRAKYLAAFLYMGGYLVLAKVTKGGRVYEPRYWFSLVGLDVLDIEEEDSSLPFSFHLCGHGHHLQLAAACHPEKAIWMTAIQDVLTVPQSWTNEPLSSLQADERQPASAVDESPVEWNMHLPTIQSSSELESQGEHPAVPPETASPTKARTDAKPAKGHRLDMALRQEQQMQITSLALNRRSSTASVKAFFSPMTLDAARITRPSAQMRQQVDQSLHDVFSENCMTARSQALMRDEELFHGRKKSLPAMSRSNSGLSITGAMGLAAKRRYDSVIVSRRKSSVPALETSGESLTTLSRAKSLASKRRKKTLPSVVPAALVKVESEAELELPPTRSPVEQLDSPSPLSQCSSTTSSNAGSALPSPVALGLPLPVPDLAQDATIRQSDVIMAHSEDYRPKRTRSMVDNVRYFFQSRPVSPSSSSDHSPTPPLESLPLPEPPETEPPVTEPPVSIVQWWRRGSLRRRVQSSPEVPGEEQSMSSGSEESRGSFLMKRPVTIAEQPSNASSDPPDGGGAQASSRRVAFTGTGTIPSRRRSLLVPSTHHRDGSPQPASGPSSFNPRRSLKNVLFFQRSNSFTPMDVTSQP